MRQANDSTKLQVDPKTAENGRLASMPDRTERKKLQLTKPNNICKCKIFQPESVRFQLNLLECAAETY
jgi:hypothetical protein